MNKTVYLRTFGNSAAIFAAGAMLAGCATTGRFNEQTLAHLYAERRTLPKPIGIFIPGVLGTVLENPATGDVAWGRAAGGKVLERLALPIDQLPITANRDSLVPSRILDSLPLFGGLAEADLYATTARIGVQAGGYTTGNINNPKVGEDAFAFRYDWRRDLVEAAQQLDEAIDRIRQGLQQPNLKIKLFCHSAGGLVARYYAKYGAVDVLDQEPLPPPTYAGAAKISQIVMLGTPNSGSMEMFQRLHEGVRLGPLGALTQEILFTMPASYELLPHEGSSVFVDGTGQPVKASLFDADNWERYGWSVFSPDRLAKVQRRFQRLYGDEWQARYREHYRQQRQFLAAALLRAKRFQQALRQGDPIEEQRHVQYVVMGADCQLTLRRALLRQVKGKWRTSFESRKPSLESALYCFGDRSVTRESLVGIVLAGDSGVERVYRLPGVHPMFFCENHDRLTKNVVYMDNVLNVFLEE